METTRFIPVETTSRLFGGKNSVTYNPTAVWGIFKKIASGLPLTPRETAELWDFFVSIGILIIKEIYPSEPAIYKSGQGIIQGQDQVDEMMDIIEGMNNYFTKDAQKRVINHFPTCPVTDSEKQRFHAHFKKKGKLKWIDDYRKRKNDPLARRIAELNDRLPAAVGVDDSEDSEWDGVICNQPFETIFANSSLYSSFMQRYEPVLHKAIIKESICGHLQQGNNKQIIEILSVLLSRSGYKVAEGNGSDSGFALVVRGSSKPIHPDLSKKDQIDSDQIGLGIVIALKPQVTKEIVGSLRSEAAAKGLTKALVISDLSKPERESLRHGIGTDGLEAWDLLELAEYIQRTFKTLDPEEQSRVNVLIESLTTGY